MDENLSRILHELESLRRGQDELLKEVQSLAKGHAEHASWVSSKLQAFEGKLSEVRPVHGPSSGVLRASGGIGTFSRKGRSYRPTSGRPSRPSSDDGGLSRDHDSSTFEDALERFNSFSTRWSDCSTSVSQHVPPSPALATSLQPPVARATPAAEAHADQEDKDRPSTDPPHVAPAAPEEPGSPPPFASPFSAASLQRPDFNPLIQSQSSQQPPAPVSTAETSQSIMSLAHYAAAAMSRASTPTLQPASAPRSWHAQPLSTPAYAAPDLAGPDVMGGLQPVFLLPPPPQIPLPSASSAHYPISTQGGPRSPHRAPAPHHLSPHPSQTDAGAGVRAHASEAGVAAGGAPATAVHRSPVARHTLRNLATRSMFTAGPHRASGDGYDGEDEDLTDAEAMANTAWNRRGLIPAQFSELMTHSHSVLGARPPGTGTQPATIRNRYMDNIPARLRLAYEAQSAMELAHAKASGSLARLSNQSHTPSVLRGDTTTHPAQPAPVAAGGQDAHGQQDARPQGPSLPGSQESSAAEGPEGQLWQPYIPGAGGRTQQAPSTVSWHNGGVAVLPPSRTGSGPLTRTSDIVEGSLAGGPPLATVGSGRAMELMADAPALLLKSFTHLARPSLAELQSSRSRGGYATTPLAAHAGAPLHGGGMRGSEGEAGDAHLNMGYQGNALYVKTQLEQPPTQMLGDDDDPDRPLTRLDKVKLLLWGLINPEGRTKWDLLILVLLIWVCFASPLIVCFDLTNGMEYFGEREVLGIVEVVVDAFFVLDISLNFRTAYYDSVGNLVTDRGRIAKRYATSWFALDLISVIPFDLLTQGMFGFLSMLKLLRIVRVGKVLRLLRLYRLMRVARLPRILERIENWLDKGVLQIAMFALAVGLLAHLSACLFHYMALLTFFLTDSWEGTWVARQGLQDSSLGVLYVNSLYWAFTTVATVGYGDITPVNQKEKLMAILTMCSGVTLVGYVTSSITNLMSIRNAVSTKTAVKKQAVQDILKNRQVPSALARRVRSFFNYESTKLIRVDEEELLQDLPFKLRSRFLQHAYADTLSRMHCLVRLRPDILIDVIAQLQTAYFTDGDIIALQGDLVTDLYFVHEGKLELRVYDFPDSADPWAVLEAVNKDELAGYAYTIQGRLKRPYYFGHASAVHGGTWPATVVARNCCEMFTLSHAALEGLASRHPQALAALLEVSEPPAAVMDKDPSAFTIDLLRVDIDPEAIAADFPLLDAPPRKKGFGQLLVGAVKGVSQGLATLSHAVTLRQADNAAGANHQDVQTAGDQGLHAHSAYVSGGDSTGGAAHGKSGAARGGMGLSRFASEGNSAVVAGTSPLKSSAAPTAQDAAGADTVAAAGAVSESSPLLRAGSGNTGTQAMRGILSSSSNRSSISGWQRSQELGVRPARGVGFQDDPEAAGRRVDADTQPLLPKQ